MPSPLFCPLADGRQLAYDVHGPAGAPAVLAFHGSPGSRLDFWPSPAMPLGALEPPVRLVAVDRPGVGQSTHQPGRTLTDWANDVAQLVDHLELPRFCVLGYSGGGAYALQVAAALPHRVKRVALAGAVAPPEGRSMDDGSGLGPRLGFELVRYAGVVAKVGFTVANRALAVVPDLALALGTADMCAADRQLLRTPALRENRVAAYREAARNGPSGAVHDVALVASNWGFSLDEVTAPTTVWAGADDNFVPLAQTRHLVDALRHSRLMLLPHTGHTLLFSHAPQIFADLVDA